MAIQVTVWSETRRAIAQWIGIVLASVLSGLLLGILLRQGVSDKLALEVALPVGFLLALLFWISISYWFSTRSVRISMVVALSSNIPNFEGDPIIKGYLYQVPPTIPTMAPQFEAAQVAG